MRSPDTSDDSQIPGDLISYDPIRRDLVGGMGQNVAVAPDRMIDGGMRLQGRETVVEEGPCRTSFCRSLQTPVQLQHPRVPAMTVQYSIWGRQKGANSLISRERTGVSSEERGLDGACVSLAPATP
nr:hypothetical protein CFP56_32498 [Quercus suber]